MNIRRNTKIIFLLGGLLILFIHFGLIVIYANPFVHDKGKTDYLAGAYVYPYFHQSWNLFVPVPTCNYSLFAKTDTDTSCTDIFKEILLKHQANRLSGYEPFVIAFTNSIHYFEKNAEHQKKLNGPVKDDLYFSMLEHVTKNYLLQKKKRQINAVKLILVVEEVDSGRQRVYYN